MLQQVPKATNQKITSAENLNQVTSAIEPTTGFTPSPVTADVAEVIRWQDRLQNELDVMSKATPGGQQRPWVTDLLEDLIAYEVSPAHSVSEVLTLLEGLTQSFIELENSGFGPEARNYLNSLRAEMQIIVEKMEKTGK